MREVLLMLAVVILLVWGHADNGPDCHEDEVYAVQIDTDPTHGLTWECENVEEYIGRIAR